MTSDMHHSFISSSDPFSSTPIFDLFTSSFRCNFHPSQILQLSSIDRISHQFSSKRALRTLEAATNRKDEFVYELLLLYHPRRMAHLHSPSLLRHSALLAQLLQALRQPTPTLAHLQARKRPDD